MIPNSNALLFALQQAGLHWDQFSETNLSFIPSHIYILWGAGVLSMMFYAFVGPNESHGNSTTCAGNHDGNIESYLPVWRDVGHER